MKKILAFAATLFGMTGWAGDSAPFLLDTTDPLITAPIEYNSAWIGGNASAEVVISADGVEINRSTGKGDFTWSPTTPGKHMLTYTTYINGVQQKEVYTATVFTDWKYTVADGKATIVDTTQKTGSVTIPSEIDGYPVVGLGDDLFAGCESLTSVTITDSVTSVGKNAFDGCSSLDITTQNGFMLYKGWCLEYVGADTTTLNIPDGVIGIADGAFEGKTSLKKVTFPVSSRFIGADAFAGCTQLAELNLPDNIVEIGEGAFRDCTWVQNIKMPSTLERIGKAAFANCAYLPNIVCTDGLKEIGAEAFSNCWRITSVSLPASLDSVGRDAFWNCKNLGGVTIPAHVQPLSEMFSASYSSLSSIVIAEGETELCEGAFEGCAGVTKIDIPDEVTDIPARAFKNCTSFDRVALPSGLLTIGDEAFAGCSKVGSLTLPESLTSIGSRAFNGWALLDVVTIPNNVTVIGSGAFAGCTAVRQVRMPSDVATVSATFPNAYSQIIRMTVPEDSTNIIAGFLDGCSALTVFDIPSGVTVIGDNAFRNCKKLNGITLPVELETIGAEAFNGCELISDLTIPSSVTSIGSNAFGSCALIRSVVISGEAGTLSSLFPNAYQQIVTVTVLPGSERLTDRIFAGCKSLKSVDIPTSVTEIGDGAFESCTALTSVGIPSGVMVLGKGAFRGCVSLSEITLPNGLSILEDEVFSGCSQLTAIIVPESVVELGSKVFNGCTALHSVKFVGNAPIVKSDTYGGVSSSLETSVPYASIGWDGVESSMALPEFWPYGTSHTIVWWNPIRFEVTFDLNYENGGTVLLEQVVDTAYLLPAVDPTRDGAVFAGWWTAKADGARITSASRVMQTTAHTLYAHWRMNEYSVAFDANGGAGVMDPLSMTVNESKSLTLCEFTRLDCDFAGWATEPDGEIAYRDGAEVMNLTLVNDAIVTLYAVWTPRTWTEGDYLNQPGFVFTSEGDEPWVMDGEVSHDGIGSLRSGAIGASAEYSDRTCSTLKTTVVGEGTGSFWWKVHCEEMDTEYGDWFDYAVFTIDGVEIAKIAGDTDWTKVTYSVTGAGEHELVWTFTRDDYDLEGAEWLNAAWLDELVWLPKMVALRFDAGGATGDVPEAIMRQEGTTILLPGVGNLVKGTDIFKGWSDGTTLYAPCSEYTFGSADVKLTAVWEVKVWTLAEAADAETLVLATGGDSDWTIDATSGYTNTMSVKSGVVASGQESWIETKVKGAGILTFRWKVMGGLYRNNPFAYAKVVVDDMEVASEYLTDGWEEVSLTIEDDKEHTVRWIYLRTSSRVADGDCAWIDAVTWMGGARYNIAYENLKGATHQNPSTYYAGMSVKFTDPSTVDGYVFTGWMPSEITASDTGNKIVTANWEWTPQDALVDASITGGKPITVKADWVKTELEKKFGVAKKDEFIAKFGDNLTSAMTKKTGKRDGVGNELLVWHDYVAGTDPTDVKSTFKAKIEMKDGKPIISWEPNLNSLGEERVYTVYGKESLSDIWHSPIAVLDHFFKVDVSMPREGTVTFDVGGGSSVNPIFVRVGQEVGELPTPTRDGYKFLGWFTAAEGGVTVTAETVVAADMTIYARWEFFDGHDKVQLWENGPYWATTNIGAEKPEDYGYYFWWGDTVGYKRENDDKWVASDVANSNFSFAGSNTPTYGKDYLTLQSEGWITADGVLAPEHDAAKKHWGGNWRMPTKQEFEDLINKCDWTWRSVNGVNGYIVKGRGAYVSNSIFLPCAGYGYGTSLYYSAGRPAGLYWSSVPRSDSSRAWDLYFESGSHSTHNNYRSLGQSVRPLQEFTK